MKATEKGTKGKKDAKKDGLNHFIFISFIIMAYWINIGSRGWQSLCRTKKPSCVDAISQEEEEDLVGDLLAALFCIK